VVEFEDGGGRSIKSTEYVHFVVFILTNQTSMNCGD
jgi:hypothetical protein